MKKMNNKERIIKESQRLCKILDIKRELYDFYTVEDNRPFCSENMSANEAKIYAEMYRLTYKKAINK